MELALTEGLRRLPELEVPNHLMERVFQAIDREWVPLGWAQIRGWWQVFRVGWLRWAMAGGLAAVMLVFWWWPGAGPEGLDRQVVQVWQELAAPPEVWVDFDIVARLPSGPAPDVELLTLLQ